MYFFVFGCLVLQAVYAHPSKETNNAVSLKENNTPEAEFQSRTYYSYFDNLNPLQWLNRSDDKDDKLYAIFQILECMAEEKDFSRCQKIVNSAKTTFEKKRKHTTTVKPEVTTPKAVTEEPVEITTEKKVAA